MPDGLSSRNKQSEGMEITENLKASLEDWTRQLQSPLESLSRKLDVLIDLNPDSNHGSCDSGADQRSQIITAMKSDANNSMIAHDCNLNPRSPIAAISDLDYKQWMIFQRAVIKQFASHASVGNIASFNVGMSHISSEGACEDIILSININQIRPLDKAVIRTSLMNTTTNNDHDLSNLTGQESTGIANQIVDSISFPDGIDVGKDVLISWGRMRDKIFVAARLEFVEYGNSTSTGEKISYVVVSILNNATSNLRNNSSPNSLHSMSGKSAVRYRIAIQDCDFCFFPHTWAFINCPFLRTILPPVTVPTVSPLNTEIVSCLQLAIAEGVSKAMQLIQTVSSYMNVINNTNIESASEDVLKDYWGHFKNVNMNTDKLLRIYRAVFRLVEDMAQFISLLFLLDKNNTGSGSSKLAEVEASFEYRSIDTDDQLHHSNNWVVSGLASISQLLSEVNKIATYIPIPILECRSKSWCQTVSSLLDMRAAVIALYRTCSSSLSLTVDPLDPSKLSLHDTLARLEDIVTTEPKQRIVEIVFKQFIEVNFMDDIIRQDWTSNNPYRRNQRVTPGVIAIFLHVRGFIYELFESLPHHSYFIADLSIAILNSFLHELSLIYTALEPSRTRINQWKIDMCFTLAATVQTLSCVTNHEGLFARDQEAPVGHSLLTSKQIFSVNYLQWLHRNISTASPDVAISQFKWCETLDVDHSFGTLLASIELLKVMIFLRTDPSAVDVVKDLPTSLLSQNDSEAPNGIDIIVAYQQSIESFYLSMKFMDTNRENFSAAFKWFSFLDQKKYVNYDISSDFLFLGGKSIEGINFLIDCFSRWTLTSPDVSMTLIVQLKKLISPTEESNKYFLRWIAQHLRRRLETVTGSDYPKLNENQIIMKEQIDNLLSSWGI